VGIGGTRWYSLVPCDPRWPPRTPSGESTPIPDRERRARQGGLPADPPTTCPPTSPLKCRPSRPPTCPTRGACCSAKGPHRRLFFASRAGLTPCHLRLQGVNASVLTEAGGRKRMAMLTMARGEASGGRTAVERTVPIRFRQTPTTYRAAGSPHRHHLIGRTWP
jgi:hypothetical protein